MIYTIIKLAGVYLGCVGLMCCLLRVVQGSFAPRKPVVTVVRSSWLVRSSFLGQTFEIPDLDPVGAASLLMRNHRHSKAARA